MREVFESGVAGYSKVARVAYVAKPETDEMWAKKVQNESCLKLDLAVKSEKSTKTVHIHTFQSELLAKVSAGDPAGALAGGETEILAGDPTGALAEISAEASDPAGDEAEVSARPVWGN